MRRLLRSFAALAAGGVVLGGATGANALAIDVINDSGQSAYLTLDVAAGNLVGTIDGRRLDNTTSYLVPVGGKLSGIDISKFLSGRLLLSLAAPLCTNHVCGFGFQQGDGPGWEVRWDKVEMTYDATPSGSADLSATDFFGLNLRAQTFDKGSPVAKIGWKKSAAQVFAQLSALYTNNGQTPPDPQAVVTCPDGATTCTPGRTLRVIAPSTVPPPALNSFATLDAYLGYVQKNAITTSVEGEYNGRNHQPPNPPCPIIDACDRQNYKLAAEIPTTGRDAGVLVLTGTVGAIPGTHTIIIPAAGLSQGLLGTNPDYTVDGTPDTIGGNDVFASVVRDILSGFNYGFVGSTTIDPNTLPGHPYFDPKFPNGRPYVDVPTDEWYSPPVGPDNAFDAAQPANSPCSIYAAGQTPPSTCYNQFAGAVAGDGDAYGFPFTDLLGKALLNLDPAKVDTMDFTVFSDGLLRRPPPLPEPPTAAMLLSGLFGLGGLGLIFARKPRRD